jgi:hypothetical protein
MHNYYFCCYFLEIQNSNTSPLVWAKLNEEEIWRRTFNYFSDGLSS